MLLLLGFFVVVFFRCTRKYAAQCVCNFGGVSAEGWWHRADLECKCAVYTGSRGVAVQERPGGRPV